MLLVWAPAAWVYFDAQERGLSAYVWGTLALLPFTNVVVIIFYYRHRARTEPPPLLEYTRTRIYEHVAVMTFYGLLVVATISVLFGVIEYVRAEDPPLPLEQPRETVLRETLALVVALWVISVPALVAHYALVWHRLAALPAEGAERRTMAQLQQGLFSLIVVLGGLLAAFSTVVLVFEVTGRLFDVGGLGRDLSTFGLSALPISLLAIQVAYAVLWMSPEFQRGRALLRETPPERA